MRLRYLWLWWLLWLWWHGLLGNSGAIAAVDSKGWNLVLKESYLPKRRMRKRFQPNQHTRHANEMHTTFEIIIMHAHTYTHVNKQVEEEEREQIHEDQGRIETKTHRLSLCKPLSILWAKSCFLPSTTWPALNSYARTISPSIGEYDGCENLEFGEDDDPWQDSDGDSCAVYK